MPGKGGDKGGKAINALAGGAAAYVARKVIVFAWTKLTGRQPPDFNDSLVLLSFVFHKE